ncbi:MAG: rod shape-determining protein MreC [Pseudomonadota bacterium]
MEYLGQNKREGLGRKANSRFLLILLILVSLLLLLSSLYSARASVFEKAREGVLDATAPILEIISGPIRAVNDIIGYTSDYFSVLEQNKALREENAVLRQWMNEALELRETLAAYEGLDTFSSAPPMRSVDAFVIGEANSAYAHSMIVNAGRQRNIEVGQAVIDDRGLVGRIVDTGTRASRILLLTDVQSRVPVYIEGADVDGILVGRTRARPAISFTESAEPAELAPGQRVLTSGAGGVLPRGLPIGVIDGERREEIVVRLYANYNRTRLVRIINYEFPSIIDGNAGAQVESRAAATPSEG